MNEPIRCRSLISLVARYPGNQREMNSHCGVTETKMTVVVEGGHPHKSFTLFTEGQSSASSHQTWQVCQSIIFFFFFFDGGWGSYSTKQRKIQIILFPKYFRYLLLVLIASMCCVCKYCEISHKAATKFTFIARSHII